ncbi:MAG: hypothetical protein LBH00_08535 [Planctomycetaceae bacterium]|nr:hypothetical protein [Planctomycetaceae bacterium]
MFLSLIRPAAVRKLSAAVLVALFLCVSAAAANAQTADPSDSGTKTKADVVDKTGGKHARTHGSHSSAKGEKHACTDGKCDHHGSKGGKKHARTDGKCDHHGSKGGKHACADGKSGHYGFKGGKHARTAD